nr:MAG TPA: hypothetical protein [Caudoviricetes sp.]
MPAAGVSDLSQNRPRQRGRQTFLHGVLLGYQCHDGQTTTKTTQASRK